MSRRRPLPDDDDVNAPPLPATTAPAPTAAPVAPKPPRLPAAAAVIAKQQAAAKAERVEKATAATKPKRRIKPLDIQRQVLTADEAGEYLGVSRITMWRMTQAGKVRGVDVGAGTGQRKRYRYRIADLEAYLAGDQKPANEA